ncbi:MAG: hypothetical protein Q7S17_08225, partial [Xanthobacteraceae bacterium]|nr:hypothetical protein [Xanthobacteraceae bacterium]
NNILRGIAAKIMPCHYCGAADIALCPHGFPGCALADDLYPADAAQATWMRDLRKRAETAEAALATARDEALEELALLCDTAAYELQKQDQRAYYDGHGAGLHEAACKARTLKGRPGRKP